MEVKFHRQYTNLLSQLPPSIKKECWHRLTTRKHNGLSKNVASSINPTVEEFLKHEVERYEQKKMQQRKTNSNTTNSSRISSNIPIEEAKLQVSNLSIPRNNFFKKEVDLQVENAIKEIMNKNRETLKKFKNAIVYQESILCIETMKDCIRDGSIYNLFRELEAKDGKNYIDQMRGA